MWLEATIPNGSKHFLRYIQTAVGDLTNNCVAVVDVDLTEESIQNTTCIRYHMI